MKYFTKEELEDITRELLENPTRETLKSLNDKYNGSAEIGEPLVKEVQTVNVEPPVVASIPNVIPEEQPVVEPAPVVVDNPQIASSIPNLNIPSMEVPKTENITNNNANVTEIPSFELPKLETPTFSNQNNEPVNFSGNLWDTPNTGASNLMQTTDNFNAMPNTMPNTEVPVNGAPFFGPSTEPVNNPIPVGNTPVQGPTMFGQLEQNYM